MFSATYQRMRAKGTSWAGTSHVLTKCLCWLCEHSVIEKWFKQTYFVIYFTNIHSIFLHGLTSEKSRHYVLANLLCQFGVHLVIEKWLKQTHCVIYFIKTRLGCFIIWPVEKEDTIYYLNYCVDLGNIWSLNSDLSRHTVLDISIRFILVASWFYQRIKQKLFVS